MNSERISSTDIWYSRVVQNLNPKISEDELDMLIPVTLKEEMPEMCSVTFERTCVLQCKHCIYQAENTSRDLSKECDLTGIVTNIVRQLPGENPKLLHEGRIITPAHVEAMSQAITQRPDLELGLIDNGSYIRHIKFIQALGVKLQWIDLSLDGTELVHNQQRGSVNAFRMTMQGMERAHEVLKEGGTVNSLMTLTNLNFCDVGNTANFLFENGLVDGMDITTMSPARPELAKFEISGPEMATAWKQIKQVSNKFNADDQKVYFRIYRHQDFEKLAHVVGVRKFRKALLNLTTVGDRVVNIDVGRITISIDDVYITYAPLSIWPSETFLIDADGANRVAYSLGYTLSELRSGKNNKGENIQQFTVEQLNENSSLKETYHKCVDLWSSTLGKRFLKEELAMMKRISSF